MNNPNLIRLRKLVDSFPKFKGFQFMSEIQEPFFCGSIKYNDSGDAVIDGVDCSKLGLLFGVFDRRGNDFPVLVERMKFILALAVTAPSYEAMLPTFYLLLEIGLSLSNHLMIGDGKMPHPVGVWERLNGIIEDCPTCCSIAFGSSICDDCMHNLFGNLSAYTMSGDLLHLYRSPEDFVEMSKQTKVCQLQSSGHAAYKFLEDTLSKMTADDATSVADGSAALETYLEAVEVEKTGSSDGSGGGGGEPYVEDLTTEPTDLLKEVFIDSMVGKMMVATSSQRKPNRPMPTDNLSWMPFEEGDVLIVDAKSVPEKEWACYGRKLTKQVLMTIGTKFDSTNFCSENIVRQSRLRTLTREEVAVEVNRVLTSTSVDASYVGVIISPEFYLDIKFRPVVSPAFHKSRRADTFYKFAWNNLFPERCIA